MKKLLSMILALAMLLSVWSIPAVAEDGQAEEPAVVQEAAEEEAGEEEGELPEGTVLVVTEDPEPEEEEPVEEEPVAEEPVEEEPVKEEPVAEEPEAEEPVEEEPVEEEPVEEEPVKEEPVEEEPVKEEPVEEEPVEEEPVEEEPVAEEPVEEEPVEEEPVEEEPVAEEPVEEEPVKEEPVKEEPVEEEPVKEEPVEEEPVKEEPVEEEPVKEEPVHFEQGYVTVKKGSRAYTEASKKEEAGVFAADAVVYAEAEKQQDDPAKDWLKITFAVEKDAAPETAYIQAGSVKALADGEAEALEAKLEKDEEAKEYKGHKLPFVTFVKVEEPVAEETVTKEAVEQQLPVGEDEEETEEEAVEEAAPRATEKEAEPEQEKAVSAEEIVNASAVALPRVASGKLNEVVKVTVTCKNASGTPSYQWQFSTNNGKSWLTCTGLIGAKSRTLQIPVTVARTQYLYRCQVKVGRETVTSNNIKVRGIYTTVVTPQKKTASYNKTVSFTAKTYFVSGNPTYQWQQSKNNGKTWTNSTFTGSKTKTLKVKVTDASLGLKFRCVAKVGTKKIVSSPAVIYGAKVTPATKVVKYGDTVKLTTTVYNRTGTVKYQWQYSSNKGKTWKNLTISGSKTKTLKMKLATAARLTNYYRCVVTCKGGKVYTNEVHFTGNLAVMIERGSTGVSVGKRVKLISSTAFATGSVTYSWQYSTDNGKTWKKDTSMRGAEPSFTLSESKLARLYRCVVKDKRGKTATSNTIRLIDFTLTRTKPVYRALLIGEEAFSPVCTRNRGDVNHFASVLSSASAPGGTKYKVTKKFDLDYYDVRDAIQSTFAGTKDTDVSIFMIATHGYSSGDGDLSTVGYYNYSISFSTLAYWLNTYVKGKVIVILESCGSGSAIYEEGVSENADAINAADEAFVERAVSAFSAADHGVVEAVSDMNFDEEGELVENTGELRTNKFYVLTASRHRELSWGHESGDAGNYFIDWLVEGIGTKTKSPADASPKNKVLTLEELFSYVKKYNSHTFWDGSAYYTQHVQRYPKNSKYPVLMFP